MKAKKKITVNKPSSLLFQILLLLSTGCTLIGCEKKDQRPADVLDKQQLASVMIDLYLAEARLSNYAIQRDSSLALFLPKERAILTKRNMPDSILKKTYDYYLQHPDDFNKVYDILIDSLMVFEKVKGSEKPQK